MKGFTAPCGTYQPDMEEILCPDCRKKEREKDDNFISKLSLELKLAMHKMRLS